jgi:uncharacterized RDD family membrane protein YckC
MELDNPYSPPVDDLDAERSPSREGTPATRGERFAAALIDGLIALAVFTPLQIALGVYDGFPHVQPQAYWKTLLWTLAGTLVYVALHGYFLAKSSQTIGKRLIKIQIVNIEDGAPAPIERTILRRYLPVTLATALIPKVGFVLSLLDSLLIFRKSRRCLHDQIAATRVIKLG